MSVEFKATFSELSEGFSAQLGETGGGGGINYEIGSGLKVEGNVLSVDTATEVEKDNTLPITSAAVYTTVGNIDVLLSTI